MATYTQTQVNPVQPQQLELLAMNQVGEEALAPVNVEASAEASAATEGVSAATAIGLGAGVLVLGGIAIASGNQSNDSSSPVAASSRASSSTSSSAATNQAASIQIQGVAQQGQTLTAELIDPDGYAANQVKYQWQANHTNITGATGKTYVLTADEVGKTISVKADFTDNAGYTESVVSAESVAVVDNTVSQTSLTGTDGDDVIKGTDSDDILNGLAGNDILRGGKGKDEMNGGAGDDTFVLVGDVRAGEKVDNAVDNAVLGSSIAALNGIDGQEAVAGEIIRGGEGNDTLYVIGTVDLSTLTLEGIENIEIRSDVTLSASQLAAVSAISGDGNGTLRIHADSQPKVITLSDAQLSGIRHLDIGNNVTLKVNNLASITGIEIISGEGGTLQFNEPTALTIDHSVTPMVNIINADNSSAIGKAEKLNTVVAARQQGVNQIEVSQLEIKDDLSDLLVNSPKKFFDLTGSSGDDYLAGSAYHDILDGKDSKDGKDVLFGKEGNDIYVVHGTGTKIIIDGGQNADDIDTLYLGKASAAANVDLSQFTGKIGDTTTIQLGAADKRGVAGSSSEKTNLMLIIDRSGSMDRVADYATWTTRMEKAQEAALKLIERYSQLGDVAIRVIGFSHESFYEFNQMNAWMTKQDAINAINSLSAFGGTDYTVALDAAESIFLQGQGTVYHQDGKNISLFLSDGEPNSTYPLGYSEQESNHRQKQWEDFAVKHQITSYAVGFGDVNNIDKLEPIAFDGNKITAGSTDYTAGQIEPVLEKDVEQLVNTVSSTAKTDFIENLVGTAHADTLTGNSLSNEIRGLLGDDVIQGLDGKDYLFGGAGNDTFYEGSNSGSDWIHGGLGQDTIIYGMKYQQGNAVSDTVQIDKQLSIQDFTIQVKNLSDNSVDYLYSVEEIKLNGISQSAAEWLNLSDAQLLDIYKPIFYYDSTEATALNVSGEVVRDANSNIIGLNYHLQDSDTTSSADNLFVHIKLGEDLLPTHLYTESTGKTDSVSMHTVFDTQISRGGENGNRIKVWVDLEGETTYLVADKTLQAKAQSEFKDYTVQAAVPTSHTWDFAAQQNKLPDDQGLALEKGFIYQDTTWAKPDLADSNTSGVI